jgi:hypothetical protein
VEREFNVLKPELMLEMEFLVKAELLFERMAADTEVWTGAAMKPRDIFYFRCKDWNGEELEL